MWVVPGRGSGPSGWGGLDSCRERLVGAFFWRSVASSTSKQCCWWAVTMEGASTSMTVVVVRADVLVLGGFVGEGAVVERRSARWAFGVRRAMLSFAQLSSHWILTVSPPHRTVES